MKKKLQNNLYSKINQIDERLDGLESRLEKLEKETFKAFDVLQSHLARIKNGESLSDDFVLNRRGYNDLSPGKAFRIYQGKDNDFVLLDVSLKDFQPGHDLPEAIKIPLEELGARHPELPNKATSILVISEDGARSVLACEILNRKGYYNVNNVSGGYKFWPLSEDPSGEDGLDSGLASA